MRSESRHLTRLTQAQAMTLSDTTPNILLSKRHGFGFTARCSCPALLALMMLGVASSAFATSHELGPELGGKLLQNQTAAIPHVRAVMRQAITPVRRTVLRLAANETKPKSKKQRRNTQKIEILVNDEPITGYEIELRAGLLSLR